MANRRIDLAELERCYARLRGKADRVCVEGIGGWLVPLNERETVADLAARLGCAVILVAGIRLGCLNHALLTVAAIRAAGVPLAGWVANCLDARTESVAAVINTLESYIYEPLLGVVPPLEDPHAAAVAAHLSLQTLDDS
jgi:dethiobiotin synthetase